MKLINGTHFHLFPRLIVFRKMQMWERNSELVKVDENILKDMHSI